MVACGGAAARKKSSPGHAETEVEKTADEIYRMYHRKDKADGISSAELRSVVKNEFNVEVRQEDAEVLLKGFDSDRSGGLDEAEFTWVFAVISWVVFLAIKSPLKIVAAFWWWSWVPVLIVKLLLTVAQASAVALSATIFLAFEDDVDTFVLAMKQDSMLSSDCAPLPWQ